jgi:hypothetical protein
MSPITPPTRRIAEYPEYVVWTTDPSGRHPVRLKLGSAGERAIAIAGARVGDGAGVRVCWAVRVVSGDALWVGDGHGVLLRRGVRVTVGVRVLVRDGDGVREIDNDWVSVGVWLIGTVNDGVSVGASTEMLTTCAADRHPSQLTP